MGDQQKEIKPTKKFGSMQQQREAVQEFTTIGSKGKRMPTETATHATTAKAQTLPAEEMKRQTVYMPKDLAQRLKVHAALTGDDISGIITRLVEDYLAGKQP